METKGNSSTIQALKWNTVNYVVNLGSKFIITIILQRLLFPSDFGIMASVLVFTGVAQVLVDNGFQSAIIQSSNNTREALSTVFYINVLIGLLCTAILFAAAPLIGQFFHNDLMTSVTRVLSLIYLIQSFSLVQRALLARRHEFRRLAVIEIAANLLGGIAAVIYALMGGGVWSLVLMMLGQVSLISLFFWIQPGAFKPQLLFKLASVRDLWKFGSNVFLSGLFIYLNSRIDLLLTGRFLGTSSQGFYSRGKDYGLLPSGVLVGIVSKSYFPIFSRLQTDAQLLKSTYLQGLRTMALLSALLFPALFLVAGDAIDFVLGAKWYGMKAVTEWFIVLSSLYVFNSMNANFLAAIGKPRRNLINQVLVGVFRILAVFIYFSLADPVSLPVIVGLLIGFGLIENQLSFHWVNFEKQISFGEMWRHSYLILFPAWAAAFAVHFLLRPYFNEYMPGLAAAVLSVFCFAVIVFSVYRVLKIDITLAALLKMIKPSSKQ